MELHRDGAGKLNTDDSLRGCRVLITGATGVIGRAVVARLGRAGASLILVGRDGRILQEMIASLPDGPHTAISLDVTDADSWIRAKAEIDAGGLVHGLVTAAGQLGPIGPVGTFPISKFRETVDVNLFGTLLAIMTCLDGLTAARGSVVTMSGGGATGSFPRYSAYATSKAAVVRMTENIAADLEGTGIRLNAVAPGFVVSEIHDATLRAGPAVAGVEYHERTVRALRDGGDSPVEAANLICFLLSAASQGINGKLLSAVWDPWDSEAFQIRLRNEADLATLRRIDDQFFTSRRQ